MLRRHSKAIVFKDSITKDIKSVYRKSKTIFGATLGKEKWNIQRDWPRKYCFSRSHSTGKSNNINTITTKSFWS